MRLLLSVVFFAVPVVITIIVIMIIVVDVVSIPPVVIEVITTGCYRLSERCYNAYFVDLTLVMCHQ